MGTTQRAIVLMTVALLLAASPRVGHASGDGPGNDPSRGLGPARPTPDDAVQPERAKPDRDLDPAPTAPSRDREGVDLAHLSAHEAVREGNRLLDEGDAHGALEAYRQAEELRPDTREVPFVQGLAHFALGDYEQARQAFENAAGDVPDPLAFDAEYGIGTTYHAEALANLDNPELAVSHFETAMQRYHNVLSGTPAHEAAREANLKAGTMWRQLKQLLEEQEQEQEQNQEQDEKGEESQEEQSQQQDENEQEEKNDQQSPQDQEQQEENEKEPQEQESEQQSEQEQKEQQQQEAQQKEQQALREQAQRRLREMMQALRQRKKERSETEVQTVPVAPVDKDW